jgi:hypothetical protein
MSTFDRGEIELQQGIWAWGRNGEMQRPQFVTVRADGIDERRGITLSVYANRRTLEDAKSPIDLVVGPDDAEAIAAALLAAAKEARNAAPA